jgi:hypothetical protein
MKVAVCFSGLPRFIQECAPYWRNCLLEPYDCDVFVHTWRQGPAQDCHTTQLITHMYQPVRYQMEAAPQFDVTSYTTRIWPHRVTPQAQFSQFEGIRRAQLLRQMQEQVRGARYDVVIRARFDWYLKAIKLEQNPCVNVARTPTLDGHTFTYDDVPLVGISDQFAYGTSEVMDVYATTVENMPYLYHAHGVDFCGELFLRAHLHEHHMCIKQHVWQHGIVRSWGIMP